MDLAAAWTVAGLAVVEAGAGIGFCAGSHDCDGTIHLHRLLVFCMTEDPGWQDWGCL